MIKKGERISDGNFAEQVESVTFVKSVKVNAKCCQTLASYKIEIMKELELRKPYRLQEIIEIVSKKIANNGFTDSNYCLYSNEGIAQLNQLCYLELYPTIDDNDEEVYPDFVRDKSLDLFYYGQQFEDVLVSVFHQKRTASINDYIDALNYYMKNDTFMDF